MKRPQNVKAWQRFRSQRSRLARATARDRSTEDAGAAFIRSVEAAELMCTTAADYIWLAELTGKYAAKLLALRSALQGKTTHDARRAVLERARIENR